MDFSAHEPPSPEYSLKVKRATVRACVVVAFSATMLFAAAGCRRVDEGASSSPDALDHSRTSLSLPFSSLSFEEALVRARAENKLVFVDVYTDWCGWCTKMDRDVFTDARVKTALLGVVAIRVNADKGGGRRVAERYRVIGLPTFLLVSADGDIMRRFEGYRSADAFLRDLGPVSGSRR